MKSIIPLPLFCLFCVTAHSATTVSESPSLAIPDGSSSGLARNLVISGTGATIVSAIVTLEISPASGSSGFLGDLYAYLTNGSEIAVLLNRPGRTLTAPGGYGDDQTMNVTFSDTAADDIHNYRITLGGGPGVALTGQLTGVWLPDGRTTDPSAVLDSDAPTALLGAFTGMAADDNWSLFVADMSGGAEHRLVSWSLTLETVPEPSSLLFLLGATPFLMRRRRHALISR